MTKEVVIRNKDVARLPIREIGYRLEIAGIQHEGILIQNMLSEDRSSRIPVLRVVNPSRGDAEFISGEILLAKVPELQVTPTHVRVNDRKESISIEGVPNEEVLVITRTPLPLSSSRVTLSGVGKATIQAGPSGGLLIPKTPILFRYRRNIAPPVEVTLES